MRVIIIGGGACGASTAARLRRLNEDCEIIILEKTNEVSIANCGLPYYCSDVINDRDKILVSSPKKLKELLNIDVRLNSEVKFINKEEKFVETLNNKKIYYDKLVLAQGASPIKPLFEGVDNNKIFTVRNLSDADNIKFHIKSNNAKNAVVIGGGFIGVEMAENFAHLGLNTKLIELQNQILAPIDFEVASFAQNSMRDNGIELILSDGVKSFSATEILLSSGQKVPYDIAILAIGVKPEISLAKECGLEVNRGIKVNEFMQTSDADIYAGGDSVQIKDFITNEDTLIPLAGPANRQGRIIADNICGLNSTYKKSQGTAVVKVFDYTIASVGHNEKQLQKENKDYWKTFVFGNSHAGYYPNATSIMYKLLFNSKGEILGAQGIGQDGVEKRIDVIGTVMRLGGKIQDLLDSELCYAPPYSSAKDPVNILGMNADNILKGFVKPAYYEDLNDGYLIDVRPQEVFNSETIENAINLPISEIREHLNEIPKDKKVVLFCNTGFTSYVASRILIQKGFNNIYSLMGGIKLYKEIVKDKKGILISNVCQVAKPTCNENILKIDACGLQCPGPIMKISNSINELKDGQIIEITSNDLGFKSDIGAWCNSTGNTLLDLKKEDKVIKAIVKKGSNELQTIENKNAQTIVVFSNDLDKALATFIIANGAKASGKEVTLFFTFWGLNILRKSNITVKKGLIDKMFGLMMPKGADKLTLSKMNMGGLGSMMMKWVMKNKNVSTLNELIYQAQAQGIKFIACNMSMDIMGIKPEELIDGIEFGGVAKYINESNNANSNLFI